MSDEELIELMDKNIGWRVYSPLPTPFDNLKDALGFSKNSINNNKAINCIKDNDETIRIELSQINRLIQKI